MNAYVTMDNRVSRRPDDSFAAVLRNEKYNDMVWSGPGIIFLKWFRYNW